MPQPQGAHLVGSINFNDAETTIRTAADILGGRLKRIPDGEVGARFHWILFQPDVIGEADGLERIGDEPILVRGLDARPVRIADGVDAASIVLPPLGYADAAIESYAIFSRLRDEGAVPEGVRFQVSLPTPVGVIAAFFRGDDRPAIEPVYAAALRGELERIVDAIPHDDLAIQWDVATEFAVLESGGYEETYGGAYSGWFDDQWAELPARVAALVNAVPADVEVGIHLCYGDAGEAHFFEPVDTANLTRFANAVLSQLERPLTWLHLPVPIERDDAAYFAPLSELALDAETEFYLGLVHREDGVEGARRRIAAASTVVTEFGVATECGIGRAPEGTTEGILRTHAEVASAW
ncbi:hypothetical protein [Microbacterium rhizomatis]|uniref:Methionine synthase n=1 Tax=Microbacterium rhizomatis TaxID=1631477 RepID=A0A5J5J2K8_9MICO|nr:hypothetical protein [Microbacterium rhizomatis]KAA9106538.1 hypothetical protein F6B43_15515 [Microbacterium rhizomatis]